MILPCGVRAGCGESESKGVLEHANCIWFFVAKCDTDMPGRAEHTDQIEHDGTWHYQLRGKKRWYIRPTEDLLSRIRDTRKSDSKLKYSDAHLLEQGSRLVAECCPGDVLIINTRLWWHRTEIPASELSISYARDVFFAVRERDQGSAAVEGHAAQGEEEDGGADAEAGAGADAFDMCNVESFRVEGFFEQGSVIWEEEELPPVPLPTSRQPNCELMIWEPTGKTVLVALRDIEEGEHLTVAAPA